jgi:hypothetical protein
MRKNREFAQRMNLPPSSWQEGATTRRHNDLLCAAIDEPELDRAATQIGGYGTPSVRARPRD